MTRTLPLAVMLVLQTAVRAQDGSGAAVNPVVLDSLWQYHVRTEAYVRARRTLNEGAAPRETLDAAIRLENRAAALAAARELLAGPPSDITYALNQLLEHNWNFTDDGTTTHRDFVAVIAAARQKVDDLSPEAGAAPAMPLLSLEYVADRANEDAHQRRIAAFRERYRGTPEANEFDVSQVEADRFDRDFEGRLQRFRDLAKKYDRTIAGAEALYLLGFRQGHPVFPQPDPTERLLEVFDVVRQLESGRFPPSRWVDSAPGLVQDFYFGLTTAIPPDSVPRLYAEYLAFVLAHPDYRGRYVDGNPFSWIISNGVARLGATNGERLTNVERFFRDLEQGGFGTARTSFERARFYWRFADRDTMRTDEAPLLTPKESNRRALQLLEHMVTNEQPTEAGRALAMLADADLAAGRNADAERRYQRLAGQFPASEWAWVAALRAAQATEARGDTARALVAYEAVAERHHAQPTAALLARIAAGEIREQRGDFATATVHFQAAMAIWRERHERLELYSPQIRAAKPHEGLARYSYLTRGDLEEKLIRLANTRTLEDRLLYDGRRALEAGKPHDAVAPLQRLVKSYPRGTAAVEGRRLLRRAKLAEALVTSSADASGTERDLDALTRGPYDSVTSIARIASGALRLRTGGRAQAESITTKGLEEWHAKQATAPQPTMPLARDVAAIRAELFKPTGGGVYGSRGGNAFEWEMQASSPFLLVTRDVLVRTADGREAAYPAPFPVPAGTRVIFATDEELADLRLILDHVGGTQTREWNGGMDTPNQPLGLSVKIAEVWGRFFPMRPGHWGGWELTAYPRLTRITFDRENHALAEVTIGYSGGTIECEKVDAKWIARRMVSMWIT